MSLKDAPVDGQPTAIGKALAEALKEQSILATVSVGLETFGIQHPRAFRVVLTYDEGPGTDAFEPSGTVRGVGSRSKFFEKSYGFRMAISGRSDRPGAKSHDHQEAVDVFADVVLVALLAVCHAARLSLSRVRGGFPLIESSATEDTPAADGAVYVLSGQIGRGVLGPEHAVATGLVPTIPLPITVGV